jgi:Fe-S cluster assembly scaffold protein SufB/intein/homing endonuclease
MSRFATKKTTTKQDQFQTEYEHGYSFSTKSYAHILKPGLTEQTVREISHIKEEPKWMLKLRLQAYQQFLAKKTPTWGADLSEINYDSIRYYLRATDQQKKSWKDVPPEVKETFERLGIPEAERSVLAGVKAQYDSEMVYGSLHHVWADQGVVFLSMDEGLKQYPDLVMEYFGKVIPSGDNKFSALNTAVWSGGSFVYVPAGVEVKMPLQTYFRINAENSGQFERTLIIVDEGAKVHYIEGCTAPNFSTGSLHSAVVEIFVKPGARCQYTTVQNWYKNVYNLVTKRAYVESEAEMVWTDFNMGCLTASSRVFIEGKGVISIKEVKPNDITWSTDLNQLKPIKAKVIATKNTGVKPVFELVTENKRSVVATENHPFLTMAKASLTGGHSRLQWKQLKDISIGDKVGVVRGLNDPQATSYAIDFNFSQNQKANKLSKQPIIPKQTSVDLMWLLGIYLGGRSCQKSENGIWSRVYFYVPEQDEVSKRLKLVIEKTFEISPIIKGTCLTIASAVLATLIRKLGFTSNTETERIPGWVYDLPLNQKLSFIQGYFDSNGIVVHQKDKKGAANEQLLFASVNNNLLEDMKLLMISAGLNPIKLGSDKELVESNSESSIEFVRVVRIESKGDQEVFDLEIDGVSNFIANGLVVHNSKLTMKYPGFVLAGKGARGETLSMALAGAGQHQDTGSKAIHLAPYTSSTIISKSISKDGGRTSYRGLVNVGPNAHHSQNTVICDALLLDGKSRSDTYPIDTIHTNKVAVQHEATVSKIGDDQLFYLMSRGVKEEDARKMIVNGFIEDLVRHLPLEYAVEMNRLIDHEMEGSIG